MKSPHKEAKDSTAFSGRVSRDAAKTTSKVSVSNRADINQITSSCAGHRLTCISEFTLRQSEGLKRILDRKPMTTHLSISLLAYPKTEGREREGR